MENISATSTGAGNSTSALTSGLKEKSLKFHQEIVRGLNIARSMGLNNERLTPLFAYHLFKAIS